MWGYSIYEIGNLGGNDKVQTKLVLFLVGDFMLRKKALRKIFITTMSLFIIMTIYLIPLTEKTLETNLEFEYITDLANSSIYLLDENNYLVKTKVLLDNEKIEDNIKSIINNLTISDESKFPDNLESIIPKKTKLNSINIESDSVTLDFSKELLKVDEDLSAKLIEAIVFSITEIDDINKVNITVESTPLETYPNSDKKLIQPLTREIGINNEYTYNTLDNITKVVIYYGEDINDDIYYVPVTKYLNNNDNKDKINIIVEELTTSYIYEDNLKSILNENTRLIDKELVDDDLLILNFNNALFDSNSKIKEEVLYILSYSAFANYSVNTISFRVDGQDIETVKRSDLN